MNESLLGFIYIIAASVSIFLIFWFLKRTFINVRPFESALFTRLGKLQESVSEEGLVFKPSLVFPWESVLIVSRRVQNRAYREIHFNDSDGTQAKVDLWIEFKIVDPVKAIFAIEDWSVSLKNVVSHAGTAILGRTSLEKIIADRDFFSKELQSEVDQITLEWGIKVQLAFIQNLHLTDELIRQFVSKVSAEIEIMKAKIEEAGRIRVQQLDADTEVKVAELNALSKSQNMLAVGRAYSELAKKKEIQSAFEELYRLSKLNPARMTTFLGFGSEGVRALDALMIAPNTHDSNVKIDC